MAYIAATHGERSSGPGMSLPGKVARRGKVARASKVAWAVTAFAVASTAAAWFAGFNPTAWVVADAAPTATAVLTFNDRFAPGAAPSVDASARQLVQYWSSEIELKLQQAKSRLAQKLQSEKLLPQDFRTAPIEDPKPAVANASGIPLPRARPVEPKLEAESAPTTASTTAAAYARPDDRTLLQKFSDLLPTGRITLASLAPNGGPYHDGPDLGALGYDKLTAVYDISAHAVYLPNGSRLEAHSGMGNLMDDPEHVNLRMVGATPPTTYDLKPRERLFHGVEALRMIPLDGSATLGRSGLLTHSFMLGPNGQSNGCVSIRNYDSFLQAYKDGVINRLVVVPSLNNAVVASRQS
jgi:Protein of unknown function (DUF2778)